MSVYRLEFRGGPKDGDRWTPVDDPRHLPHVIEAPVRGCWVVGTGGPLRHTWRLRVEDGRLVFRYEGIK